MEEFEDKNRKRGQRYQWKRVRKDKIRKQFTQYKKNYFFNFSSGKHQLFTEETFEKHMKKMLSLHFKDEGKQHGIEPIKKCPEGRDCEDCSQKRQHKHMKKHAEMQSNLDDWLQ